MTPNKCLKMIKLIKIGVLGLKKTFGAMAVTCMTNSGHGGPPGTRVMTIFGFYVSTQTLNIAKNEEFGGLQAPGGISSFFSSNFLSNAIRIMSVEPFSTPVMTIFVNVTILDIYIYVYRDI